jgi:hypothetical protein
MNNLDVLDGGNVLIRCLIKDTDGDYQGYFDFTVEDEKVLVYSKALVTNDVIDSHNRLCITNSIYSLEEKYTYDELGSIVDTYIPAKDTANEEDAVDEFYIDESVDIEVCILIKDVKYGQVLPDVLGKMEDLRSEYSLAVKFVNSGLKFSLFTVLNDVINPTLVYRPSTYTEGGVQIQSMPVIGSHYFKTYETYMNFFDIFSIYYDVLTANFEKLENNTSLDLKFYNTYGYSKYFSSYSTNITLNIVIKLSGTFSNTLDLSIKNYIVAFVEEVNNSTTKNLAISNLMRGLEKNFTEIEYVELESLDGLDPSIQVIESASSDVSDMSREQLINYIPEFLNIDMKEEAYIYGADNFQTGITITYK